MSGSALSSFGDFVKSTGPAFLTGDTDIVNEAVKRGTYTLSRFMTGKDKAKMLQGGDQIEDLIFFTEDVGYEHYAVNATFTYDNPQFLNRWVAPWRFTKGEMVYTEQELGLNGSEMTKVTQFHRYKRLKDAKEMNLWTGMVNGMEEDLWSVPDKTTMEAADGGVPYSIPAFVNEFANGLPSAAHPGGAWTTVQGIDPATYTKWDNVRETYFEVGEIGIASALNTHLFTALRRAYNKLYRGQLPKRPEFSDMATSPTFIGCSSQGLSNYELCLQSNQDTFVAAGRQDPAYTMPQFHGIPLDYIEQLDTAAIYPTGAAAALSTEDDTAGTDNAGPRYWLLNTTYMLMAFHRERFFKKIDPFFPSAQPFTLICLVDNWHNNIVRSRNRQGIVYPSGGDVAITAAA